MKKENGFARSSSDTDKSGFISQEAVRAVSSASSFEAENKKNGFFYGWNAPANLITYFRLVLSVAFLIVTLKAGTYGCNSVTLRWISYLLFAIAAFSDKLDGYLARKYNQITELGKLLDPIADKLLVCGGLIVLSIMGELWWAVTILFLVREIGITIMRFFAKDENGKVIAASKAGKMKTFFQCSAVGLLLIPVNSIFPGNDVLFGKYRAVCLGILFFALVLCLYSGFCYAAAVFKNSKNS